jgi:TPR repeat protein
MGYHKSQIEIGKMFENLGSNYYKNAIEWYTHAKLHRIISGYAHIGDIYFKQGYRENAEEQYKIAANKQDPYGQSRLGVYYRSLSSWGIYRVHDDYITAMVSLNKAAEQNYPYGQYELACMYENGCGTDVDKYQALTLYQKSKAGGYGPAGDRINDLNKQCYFHIPQSTY